MQQTLKTDYRSILVVALPLIVGNFIQSLVLITDMAFLSHLGDLEFDAAGNGGMVYITFYMIAVGLGDGMQISIARFLGQSDLVSIRRTFQNGLLTLLAFAIFFFLLLKMFIPSFFETFSNNESIASFQNDYIGVRSYSIFLGLLAYGMMSFLLAVGKTKIVFITSIVMSAVNVFGDYTLVFGKWGFPEMGVEGAALASVFADLSTVIILSVYFATQSWIKEYQLFNRFSFEWMRIKQLFKLSWPLMVQGFLSMGTWTVFFVMIEQMGQRDLEISQNIRAMYFLAFVPIFGFAATTKTYVSQLLGAGKHAEIALVQKKILILVVCTVLLFFHGALLYPEFLISMVNPRADVVNETALILRQIFPAVLIFAFTSVFYNTISGSGNTRVSLLIEFVCVFFYLLVAYIFIFQFDWYIGKVWYVEYIYFFLLALSSLIYLKFFDWKKKSTSNQNKDLSL
jgi:putative MATE family efflux protein